MAKTDLSEDLQFAALPYRLGRHGLDIILITSRETRSWVIPKGLPMEGRHPHRTAEIEAFHEAGVKGSISRKPIGAYPYAKPLPEGSIFALTPGILATHPPFGRSRLSRLRRASSRAG